MMESCKFNSNRVPVAFTKSFKTYYRFSELRKSREEQASLLYKGDEIK